MITQECLQALKDGKEIRHLLYGGHYSKESNNISIEYLINHEWEIVEKKVTITASEFDAAYVKVLRPINLPQFADNNYVIKKMREELFK